MLGNEVINKVSLHPRRWARFGHIFRHISCGLLIDHILGMAGLGIIVTLKQNKNFHSIFSKKFHNRKKLPRHNIGWPTATVSQLATQISWFWPKKLRFRFYFFFCLPFACFVPLPIKNSPIRNDKDANRLISPTILPKKVGLNGSYITSPHIIKKADHQSPSKLSKSPEYFFQHFFGES